MTHKRGILVSEYDQRDTELLGDDTKQYHINDVGKLVKYNGIQVDLCVAGDDIVGAVESVEPYTAEQGHSVGTVKKSGRVKVVIGAGEVGTLAVGGLVVADAQTALGTVGLGAVKGGAPATWKWAVVWLLGDGTAGTEAYIERV